MPHGRAGAFSSRGRSARKQTAARISGRKHAGQCQPAYQVHGNCGVRHHELSLVQLHGGRKKTPLQKRTTTTTYATTPRITESIRLGFPFSRTWLQYTAVELVQE
jgi:hypothetical protein